ncbi:hypothetical protein [Embleya hyalina]|uniref:Uncharacterized protein n=1 Tax=Embleya hyalina TaxID=516124 RepID=A0A401YZ64_9ACTN|nr:hypothetical protein [Embleya hyalina]GCD99878.1 hypothetical protein EHYA_07600 [Embleya hyalina]
MRDYLVTGYWGGASAADTFELRARASNEYDACTVVAKMLRDRLDPTAGDVDLTRLFLERTVTDVRELVPVHKKAADLMVLQVAAEQALVDEGKTVHVSVTVEVTESVSYEATVTMEVPANVARSAASVREYLLEHEEIGLMEAVWNEDPDGTVDEQDIDSIRFHGIVEAQEDRAA